MLLWLFTWTSLFVQVTTLKCVCPLKGGPITTQHAHVILMPSRVIPQWGIRIMPQWDIIRDLNISDPRSPVSDIPPWGFNRGKTVHYAVTCRTFWVFFFGRIFPGQLLPLILWVLARDLHTLMNVWLHPSLVEPAHLAIPLVQGLVCRTY